MKESDEITLEADVVEDSAEEEEDVRLMTQIDSYYRTILATAEAERVTKKAIITVMK